MIAQCARLPLALSIVAARAAARPSFPLASIAAELRESGGRLDAFNAGDASTDIRYVFSWSRRALSPGAARLLWLLGLHAGPDIALPAVASLASLAGVARVRPLLDELVQASLLAEHRPGRYAFHGLLQAYAAEQAAAVEDGGERTAARRRAWRRRRRLQSRRPTPGSGPSTRC